MRQPRLADAGKHTTGCTFALLCRLYRLSCCQLRLRKVPLSCCATAAKILHVVGVVQAMHVVRPLLMSEANHKGYWQQELPRGSSWQQRA